MWKIQRTGDADIRVRRHEVLPSPHKHGVGAQATLAAGGLGMAGGTSASTFKEGVRSTDLTASISENHEGIG